MTDQPQEKIRMTVEQFKALPQTNQRMELIHGELIIQSYSEDDMSAAPYDIHQKTITQLIIVIAQLITGGELRAAPSDVYIDGVNVVQPDVFWISPDNNSCQLKDNYGHGSPDLVVEVLSKSTAQRDKREKYDIYEMNGVREYWIVDIANATLDVYILREGRFLRYGVYGMEDSFESPVFNQKQVKVNQILPSWVILIVPEDGVI